MLLTWCNLFKRKKKEKKKSNWSRNFTEYSPNTVHQNNLDMFSYNLIDNVFSMVHLKKKKQRKKSKAIILDIIDI